MLDIFVFSYYRPTVTAKAKTKRGRERTTTETAAAAAAVSEDKKKTTNSEMVGELYIALSLLLLELLV